MTTLERLKLDHLPFWVHLLAWSCTSVVAVMMLVIFWIYRDTNVWEGLVAARELRNPEYHELIHEHSIFRTRVNTVSNLVYVLVGFYIVSLGVHDLRRRKTLCDGYLAATPAQSFFFGIACIYVGLGSAFFHASLTRLGQQIDVGGMYAVVIAMMSVCLGSWLPYIRIPYRIRPVTTWPLLLALSTLLSAYFLI